MLYLTYIIPDTTVYMSTLANTRESLPAGQGQSAIPPSSNLDVSMLFIFSTGCSYRVVLLILRGIYFVAPRQGRRPFEALASVVLIDDTMSSIIVAKFDIELHTGARQLSGCRIFVQG